MDLYKEAWRGVVDSNCFGYEIQKWENVSEKRHQLDFNCHTCVTPYKYACHGLDIFTFAFILLSNPKYTFSARAWKKNGSFIAFHLCFMKFSHRALWCDDVFRTFWAKIFRVFSNAYAYSWLFFFEVECNNHVSNTFLWSALDIFYVSIEICVNISLLHDAYGARKGQISSKIHLAFFRVTAVNV